MNKNQPFHSWYAVHIRSRSLQHVSEALAHKGYEIFSPTYSVAHHVGGRRKTVEKPLFPGYLFCAMDPNERMPVLMVSGVIAILGTANVPTPVAPDEINGIRRMVESGLPTEPYRLLEPGVILRVEQGPLKGVKGVLVTHRGSTRLVMTLSLLNRSVAAEIDSSWVSVVTVPQRIPASPVVYAAAS